MKRQWPRCVILAGLLLLLVGACGQLPLRERAEKTGAPPAATAPAGSKPGLHQRAGYHNFEISARGEVEYPDHVVEPGSGGFVAQAAPRLPAEPTPGDITLDFQNADIREFLHFVLKDTLNENYLVDENVAGTVTVAMSRPIDRKELMTLTEEVLAMNAAALVKTDDLWRVVLKEEVFKGGRLTPTLTHTPDGHTVRIIPLQYISAQEMQKILEPFVTEENQLRVDPKRNLIFIAGTQQEMAAIMETVAIFDVDWMRGLSVGLFLLDHVEPGILKRELDEIMAKIHAEDKAATEGLVSTVALDRLGSLLAISRTPAGLGEVELWVERLDRIGQHANRRVYIYDLQNAKAVELADLLSRIFSVESDSSDDDSYDDDSYDDDSYDDDSYDDDSYDDDSYDDDSYDDDSYDDDSYVHSGRVVGFTRHSLSESRIDIIADDVRNALLVTATPNDYAMVEATIAKLDVVPLQVLIEASIVEVTLKDSLEYGVEWFFKNNIDSGSLTDGRGILDLGNAGLAALAPSFSYTIIDSSDQVRFALNLLEEESEVNVLSSPTLMVLDNQTAHINVGDEIPVPIRQATSNLHPSSPTVNEIEFRKTGVTLTVTPRVNSVGMVTMDINQEVSTAIATQTSEIDAPTIQQREIHSTVAINTGDTVVLGGLIQDTKAIGHTGIPVLKNIPLLGRLFENSRDEVSRTELLVMITPRIIVNRSEAQMITDEMKRKMRGLKLLPASPTVPAASLPPPAATVPENPQAQVSAPLLVIPGSE